MHELPAGPDAVVLDFSAYESPSAAVLDATIALRDAVDRGELPGVIDLVPSAHTLLVQARPGRGVDELGVRRALRRRRAGVHQGVGRADEILVPVHYDGDDLADVADALGISADEVISLHCSTRWRVQFMGFAPGFGYLVADEPTPHPFDAVGRRAEARTRVPEGAVAIAAGYSAVYPKESPGGWQLLGRTDVRLWDEKVDPPALFATGHLVRFVDVRTSGGEWAGTT
ncbi:MULTISPECIES: 5-oxoprolinase subunit B family protein [Gordonia]|uniref:5-oxoprolinase subunit B family protein n=1 Tax=Gordonia TaxID=2053 RepID=UPI001331B4ED|nr:MULTISPECIES: allophanate hydrolase subunit 1 [Gordonia]KAF0967902.1 5-oxoprolinase subunit B [Gordonia sp. YY1]MCR8897849.1 allophanate hydrolase subunit 1 [Gordonia sp. GONU]UOG21136.1 allophanate hydrolase subunit 1 [Gordonia amicalis]UPW13541.1 allophanate hydrolase subunit 1 [Gordonia amicalis]